MHASIMRTAFLAFFSALTVLFLIIMWPFAKPAFLAFTLAIVFAPLYRLILHKFRLHRYIAATFTTGVISAAVVLPLAVLIAVVVTHTGDFLQTIAAQVGQGSFADTLKPLLETIHEWLMKLVGSAPLTGDLERALRSSLENIAGMIYSFSPRVLSTTISVVINFLLMLLFLVVFLAEGVQLYRWLMETSPISSTHLEEIWQEMRMTITSSITAALLIAVVQGSLLGLGFWIVGFREPYSWWPIAVILSIIPLIGAVGCYTTASAILLASGKVEWAIAFFVYGVAIVSSSDNIIRSFLVRGTARIHPLLLFVTLIGAAKLFGPIGIVVGPVLLSIFLAALRIYQREFARPS